MIKPIHGKPVATNDSHRLPALAPGSRRTYEGLLGLGATGPASARPLANISKALKRSKRDLEDELHLLEGKGVVDHVSSGREVAWYCRK